MRIIIVLADLVSGGGKKFLKKSQNSSADDQRGEGIEKKDKNETSNGGKESEKRLKVA